MLGLALALEGMAAYQAIACDTDGIDGSEDNAGAIIRPRSARAKKAGVNPKAISPTMIHGRSRRDRRPLVTGPTLTNVNDFRAVLIEKA